MSDLPRLLEVTQGRDPIDSCLEVLDQASLLPSEAQSFSEIVLGAESVMAIRTHPTRLWNSDCRNYLDNTPVNCGFSLPEWGNYGGASTSPGVGELLGIRCRNLPVLRHDPGCGYGS